MWAWRLAGRAREQGWAGVLQRAEQLAGQPDKSGKHRRPVFPELGRSQLACLTAGAQPRCCWPGPTGAPQLTGPLVKKWGSTPTVSFNTTPRGAAESYELLDGILTAKFCRVVTTGYGQVRRASSRMGITRPPRRPLWPQRVIASQHQRWPARTACCRLAAAAALAQRRGTHTSCSNATPLPTCPLQSQTRHGSLASWALAPLPAPQAYSIPSPSPPPHPPPNPPAPTRPAPAAAAGGRRLTGWRQPWQPVQVKSDGTLAVLEMGSPACNFSVGSQARLGLVAAWSPTGCC